MRATYYSHASISIETRSGARLVTDPWIYNPICANALSLFPMNRIDLDEYYGHDLSPRDWSGNE
jgi:L-ascorbate metabolism protein UlaG (beta-lactamase superfamily)